MRGASGICKPLIKLHAGESKQARKVELTDAAGHVRCRLPNRDVQIVLATLRIALVRFHRAEVNTLEHSRRAML